MQISSNTTLKQTGLTVATDKDGRDFCVIVIKGTFNIGTNGEAMLAEKQEALVYADIHYGDPGTPVCNTNATLRYSSHGQILLSMALLFRQPVNLSQKS